MTTAPVSFVEYLSQLSWFHEIGQPLEEQGVVRLVSFDEWPGPEDPRVEAVHLEQQEMKDSFGASLDTKGFELASLWEDIQRRVLQNAGRVVGYDSSADAWHGPSTATWHAAWTAGLVAWHLALDRPLTHSLTQQWSWFERGRWPSGFASLDKNGRGRGWLVL